jgi:hypothetical protein
MTLKIKMTLGRIFDILAERELNSAWFPRLKFLN